MSLGRILQLAGLVWVGYVMIRSFLVEPSMLFQFGGLALGVVVFLLGKAIDAKAK